MWRVYVELEGRRRGEREAPDLSYMQSVSLAFHSYVGGGGGGGRAREMVGRTN